jgi:hypothetical protein
VALAAANEIEEARRRLAILEAQWELLKTYLATHKSLKEAVRLADGAALVAEWAKSQIPLVEREQQAAKKNDNEELAAEPSRQAVNSPLPAEEPAQASAPGVGEGANQRANEPENPPTDARGAAASEERQQLRDGLESWLSQESEREIPADLGETRPRRSKRARRPIERYDPSDYDTKPGRVVRSTKRRRDASSVFDSDAHQSVAAPGKIASQQEEGPTGRRKSQRAIKPIKRFNPSDYDSEPPLRNKKPRRK